MPSFDAREGRFRPGTTLALREVYDGRVWAVRPMRCIWDRPDILALWLPRGTPWLRPCLPGGGRLRLPVEPWGLCEEEWRDFDVLQLVETGAPWAVWAAWDASGAWAGWYLNMQEPLRRTAIGFDYFDQALDVIVSPDGSVRWKDEEELAEGVALGVWSAEEARRVRADAEALLARVQAGAFTPWECFRPAPTWETPRIPPGWDRVPLA